MAAEAKRIEGNGLIRWLRHPVQALAPSVNQGALGTILLVYFGTTAALWLLAYGASTVIRENSKVAKWHYTHVRALDVWSRWDADMYVGIVRKGYAPETGGSYYKPWFPLYPYLIKALAPSPAYHHPIGQAISLVCFFLLILVFYDIVATRLGPTVAGLAVLYISIFPSALYFRAVYAESLFILTLMLSYRAFIQERYLACGVFGSLAAMTRVPGIMLLPAFGASLVWDMIKGRKRFQPSMLLVGLIACGTGVVMWIQWQALDDPLGFLHAQNETYRRLLLPGWAVLRDFKHILTGWDFAAGKIEFNPMLDCFTAVLVGLASLYFFRRYGSLEGTLSLALLFPASLMGYSNGMIRYVLPVFFVPVFLAEIGARRPWFHALWVFFSSTLLAYYMVCYACWYWTA